MQDLSFVAVKELIQDLTHTTESVVEQLRLEEDLSL